MDAIKFNTKIKAINQEGFMAYEYNPLHNYRLTQTTYKKDPKTNKDLVDNLGNKVADKIAGTIDDLDTEELNFDLEHPVEIEIQPSYDGSVNIIMNDGINQPRLINSRFSKKELNTYEIVDRIGDNDTNIYDQGDQFKQDTSLYKKINTIPRIRFNEVISVGNLKVGNYTLYFKLEDADGNETDFIGESGIISIFKGNNKDPFSIDGGIADMNAYKSISVTISNIDSAYDYLTVYIVRTSAQQEAQRYTEVFKLNKRYIVKNKTCNVIITGDEAKTDLTINDINTQYFIADSAKTQVQCQSMLFMGNVTKPSIPYKELIDLSLTFQPFIKKYNKNDLIGEVDLHTYKDTTAINENYEYYNVHNIYYNVGYWNEELYRLGVVYIFNDGTLSPVFNILGHKNPTILENQSNFTGYLTNLITNNKLNPFKIDEQNFTLADQNKDLNAKGVIRINDNTASNYEPIYSIGVAINTEVLELYRKEIKGFFFVRQKRIPTILAQAMLMPRDQQSNAPVIKIGDQYQIESFLNSDRVLSHNYTDHLRTITNQKFSNRKDGVLICPEFETNQHYYNTLFTGSTYPVSESNIGYNINTLNKSSQNIRFYTTSKISVKANTNNTSKCQIIAITDENPLANIEDIRFRGVFGEAADYNKYRYIGTDSRGTNKANNLLRGIYSPYLGVVGIQALEYNTLVNIYIPEYSLSKIDDYFQIRYEDNSSYYPISDRFDIEKLTDDWAIIKSKHYVNNFFRGDCYTCPFTHRLNRNFQDTSAPTNDIIVDQYCWRDNYDTKKTDNNSKVNLGDVNAVQLGSWITMRVRTSTNLCIRSLDESHVNESSIVGNPRGFYPLQQATIEGSYKIPNSYIINDGFRSTTGAKENYIQPDVPYIKNNFQNRIIYSEVAVNDAFKNGYRIFNFTNFRDYSKEYGAIIKLVELHGNILCVFEHGVTLIQVNEKNLVSGSNEVFINSANVLPMQGQVLSNMFGSQWADSVIKTPYYIYGVDTVGKKIWRTNGQQFEIISDMKVNKYLVDNISLGERETTPIIGIRNVKSHYNANKSDVMFTFYNNTYGYEEKVFNLCWNELVQQFITFYSWVPSYSANIDNQFFSYDRNSSKYIAKLSGVDGLNLVNPYIDPNNLNYSSQLNLVNRYLPTNSTVTYTLVDDNYSLNKYFKITNNIVTYSDYYKQSFNTVKEQLNNYFKKHKIGYLKIKANITQNIEGQEDAQKSSWNKYLSINKGYYEFSVAISTIAINDNYTNVNKEIPSLTTDFWKHGTAGIYDVVDDIKPTNWYGQQHPFEFEFVVNGNGADSQVQKIFNNLLILSNKAEPESFHFDIVGEGYEFSNDKLNMYYRQEATKNMFQLMGSNITYNRDYLKLNPIKNSKSTVFPLYYNRQDIFEEIYDTYQLQNSKSGRDYQNLSGSELYWDKDLNDFRIITHIKNSPINKVGRLRGNSHYKEDRWDIQIPSINLIQKNEIWPHKVPPIVLNTIPKDITTYDINKFPQGYNQQDIDTTLWSLRKETKLRDKYIKIRIRYSGEQLAIITAIHTLYTISYA